MKNYDWIKEELKTIPKKLDMDYSEFEDPEVALDRFLEEDEDFLADDDEGVGDFEFDMDYDD